MKSLTPNVDNLVHQLQDLGLSTAGKKSELEKRLKRAVKKKAIQQKEEVQNTIRDEQKRILDAKPQPFDFYLVCDVEGTCHEDSGFDFANEIIEFPVLLINGATKKTVEFV